MASVNKNTLIYGAIIAFLVLSLIRVNISISFIHISRALFWIFLILGVLSLLVVLFFTYNGLIKKGRNIVATRDECFMMARLFIVVLLVFYLLIGTTYNKGYSDESLEKLVGLYEEKEQLKMVLDIIAFKGKGTTRKIIKESLNELCTNQSGTCNSGTQDKILNIYGNKDQADSIAEFLRVH